MGKQKRETTFSAHAVIEHPLGTRRFVLIEETATHKRGKFNIPGGNEDFGDFTLIRTAQRETKEETTITIDESQKGFYESVINTGT